MSVAAIENNDALVGAIVPTFFRYLIPSLLGLLAMTTASLVDGIFIGNYVGVTALAAVNLIIPIMTLLFGVGMMLSIGGSVRGGKYLGENNRAATSAIFSKTMIAVAAYGIVAIVLCLLFEKQLFSGLGADESLFPVMSEYYRVIMPFLFAELIVIVLYFFIRLDGMPNLAAASLGIGAVVNIGLDYLFIAVYGWGLQGAALATGISQLVPLLVLMSYFRRPDRNIFFNLRQDNWGEIFQAAYNGVSEFINEISGAIITFILNLMLIHRAGVNGVAAITVINYLLFLVYMIFFSVSETVQIIVSQNFGAHNAVRIRSFLRVAGGMIAFVSITAIIILKTASEPLIYMFVDNENSAEMIALATEFTGYIWPVFLFVGANVLISGYLTAIHRPFQSGTIALCHSLIMPAGFLLLFYFLLSDHRFVMALPVAEGVTFLLAIVILMRHTPAIALASVTSKSTDRECEPGEN